MNFYIVEIVERRLVRTGGRIEEIKYIICEKKWKNKKCKEE